MQTGAALSTASTGVENLEDRLLLTFDIEFRYSHDTSNFFDDPDAKAVLDQVELDFESRIEDDLLAITPGGTNSWTAVISHPATGVGTSLNNLNIPADTVVIYVGARNLASGLGLGGPGGFSSSGTTTFNQQLETRGESGVNTNGTNDTDFGPWGGSIAFDSQVPWHFGLDAPPAGQNDFYSVALHETAHVLGFGTSESFNHLINSSNLFTGTAASASHGQAVPMDGHGSGSPDDAHFESGITSLIPGTSISQESAMDPAITTGTRKVLTNLDWAALEDVGWEVKAAPAAMDYGDAPDSGAGIGIGNYQTRLSDNGPRHTITPHLFIGAVAPDGDDGILNNSTATADDQSATSDEGFTGSDDLTFITSVTHLIDVNVTNTGSSDATLFGWVDVDGDGEFGISERASATVTAGTNNGTVTLSFTEGNRGQETIDGFLRLRLSTDAAASNPTGPATDGEVEDHSIRIIRPEIAFDSLPLFTWPEDATAEYYELEVNDVTNGQNQLILQSRLYETQYRPQSALAAGKYSWRYRPFIAGSFGAYSALQTLQVFETSETPFLTDPFWVDQAGYDKVDTLPTFAWTPYVDAARYEFWLSDDANTANRILHDPTVTGTSFQPERALEPGKYRAWVRAFDSADVASSWSFPWIFTVGSSTANAGEVTSPVGTSSNGAPTIAFRPTSGTNRLVVKNVATNETVVDVDNLSEFSYTPPKGLPAGLYEASVLVNGQDAPGDNQRFEITSLANEIEVTNVRAHSSNTAPVIGWNHVDSATRYSVWVDNVSQGISQAFFSSNEVGTGVQIPGLNASDSYLVWVRAFDGFTPLTAWSAPASLAVTEASVIPTIYSPSAESESTLPTVSWAKVTGAARYEVQVSDSSGVIQSYAATSTSQQLESPLAAGHYSVTVTAKDSTAAVIGSDSMNFTIEGGDTSIELFGTDGATLNPRPTFSWSTVPNATRYVIWVNDTTNALTATIFDSELTSTSYTPNESLLAGRHQVWIRAFNGLTPLTAWSEPSTFIVGETSGVPEIIAASVHLGESSAMTFSPIPSITWTHVTAAASYDLQVRDAASGTVLQTLEGLTTTTARPTLGEGTYDFAVRSVDGSGTASAFSSAYRLQVALSDASKAPVLVAPFVRSTVATTNVLFGWTFPASSGVTYELWVNNLDTSTRPIHETSLTEPTYTESTLPAGRYRAWVRAIGTGFSSTWSVSVDFKVAST